jgi:hypothetical protein
VTIHFVVSVPEEIILRLHHFLHYSHKHQRSVTDDYVMQLEDIGQ